MKKQQRTTFFTILAASLLIGFSTTATAQVSLIAHNDKQADAIPAAEFDRTNDGASSSAAVADAQANRNFSKQFTGITNALWTKTNAGYTVQFSQNGIQNLVFLTKKGNSYITIRYYTEKELPSDVRKQIKWTYEDFNITSVKEVHRNNEPVAYLATISKANTWKDIRVVDGEIEVLDEYVSN